MKEDLRKKIFNIEHNNELSQKEKWRAKDRVLNLPLGTHETDFKNQQKGQLKNIQKSNTNISEEEKNKLLSDLGDLFQ